MMQNWIFSIHYSIFSVTWFFRNHSNMLIFCSRDILLIINVENNCAASYFRGNCGAFFFRILRFIKHLNSFAFYTVNYQFNASLLNKRVNFSKRKSYWHQHFQQYMNLQCVPAKLQHFCNKISCFFNFRHMYLYDALQLFHILPLRLNQFIHYVAVEKGQKKKSFQYFVKQRSELWCDERHLRVRSHRCD